MRSIKVLFLAGISLLFAVSAPVWAQLNPPGGGGEDTFTLKVCNGYTQPVKLAVVHQKPGDKSKGVIRGWFDIATGQCGEQKIPVNVWGVFAYAADGSKWWGDPQQRTKLCVSEQNFERDFDPNYQCDRAKGEVLVPFFVTEQTQPVVELPLK